MNYQPRPPRCKPEWLNPLRFTILTEYEIETRVFSSLFRCLERAPLEKRFPIFRLAARIAAAQLEARRQHAIDDLLSVAVDISLVELLGKPTIRHALATEFGGSR
jgi:hypothetical protein